MHRIFGWLLGLIVWSAGCSGAMAQDQTEARTPPRPNVVLILVDDAAFMDFGAYGGEASTPHIDRLAGAGALFTNYHSSPLCSPSRAMLLTGIDNHRTGHGTIEEVLPPDFRGQPGYTMRLEPGVTTLAERLQAAGYRTLMAGKWHLGRGEGDLPNGHGFDRSLALDASGADNYRQKSYMPYYNKAPWYEDGVPVKLPDRFYSTDLLVDRLIDYIDEKPAQDGPFLAYLAFQAVHIPVQVPRSYSDKYAGRFDAGWEALREARWQRARALGLVPEDAPLAPLPDRMRRWADLSAPEQAIYARSMEVYSGMLEAMDAGIGRLVERIEARGELENTIFVITSDNGPEPSDPVHATGMGLWMRLNGYHWDPDRLGEDGSLAFIGPEWAASISSPHALYKFYASQGGLKVPLIVSGPGVVPGVRSAALTHVTDVTPTLLDLTGVGMTEATGQVPVSGKSLSAILNERAASVRSETDRIGIEVSGNAALFKGDYKIVRNMPPVGDGAWHLFNLALDPGETRDLSISEPDRLSDLIAEYEAYAAENGVLPLPPGYRVERQILHNVGRRQLQFYGGWIALAGLALLVALYVVIRNVFLIVRGGRRRG